MTTAGITEVAPHYHQLITGNEYLVVNRYIKALAPIAAQHCNYWWNSSNLPTEYASRQESSFTRYSNATPKGELVYIYIYTRAPHVLLPAPMLRIGKYTSVPSRDYF